MSRATGFAMEMELKQLEGSENPFASKNSDVITAPDLIRVAFNAQAGMDRADLSMHAPELSLDEKCVGKSEVTSAIFSNNRLTYFATEVCTELWFL